MSLNKVMLIGNLGKAPEVRTLENGKVATFSIATSEKYKNQQGELVENTQWHNIVIWNKLAELAEKYLVKGSQIYLGGKLSHRSYEKDGVTKYITEVVGSEMRFLGGKKKESNQTAIGTVQQAPMPEPQPANIPSPADDSLPF